jgi:hypothetical protein
MAAVKSREIGFSGTHFQQVQGAFTARQMAVSAAICSICHYNETVVLGNSWATGQTICKKAWIFGSSFPFSVIVSLIALYFQGIVDHFSEME